MTAATQAPARPIRARVSRLAPPLSFLRLLRIELRRNAMPWLLPLIAAQRLGLGSSGYGVLLSALGAGAIGGALLVPHARARLPANALAAVASLAYAAALAAAALSRDLALTIVVLLPAAAAWTVFLSNVNAALQLFLPRWVRARGLSVYQMVLFGAQAAGAAIWGVVAGAAGLVPASIGRPVSTRSPLDSSMYR